MKTQKTTMMLMSWLLLFSASLSAKTLTCYDVVNEKKVVTVELSDQGEVTGIDYYEHYNPSSKSKMKRVQKEFIIKEGDEFVKMRYAKVSKGKLGTFFTAYTIIDVHKKGLASFDKDMVLVCDDKPGSGSDDQQGNVLMSCSNIPTKGYPKLQIVAENWGGKPYLVTYLIDDAGKRTAVESYPDRDNETEKGIKKPSFHIFKIGDKKVDWQLINYKNALPAGTDDWTLVRIGGGVLTAEEKKKYPGSNQINSHVKGEIPKIAFYDMECKESIPTKDPTQVTDRVIDQKRKTEAGEFDAKDGGAKVKQKD